LAKNTVGERGGRSPYQVLGTSQRTADTAAPKRPSGAESKLMGAAENLELHTRWDDAENRHDLSRHDDYLHPDIEVLAPGVEPMVGIAAYRAMMEANFDGLPDFHTDLDDRFATDDRVVCRWRVSGTHSGELYGFPATGRRIEYAGVSIWEFETGKARRGWLYVDLPALMAQLSPS
jgi:steroid delta-isomerase-like uncharacterized protein